MIHLFVADIDGCLAEPYRPYDLRRMQELSALIRRAGWPRRASAPAFSICSGRAYPYVEAMTQVLGVQAPVLFEAGGGLFDPVAAQVTWNPRFDEAMEEQVAAVRAWMVREVAPGTHMMYDYGKRTQAGLIGPDAGEVARHVALVEDYVAARYPDLCVYHTSVSIDVLPREVTKKQALHWLADVSGVPVAAMAYIGDSNGDLGALGEVGHAFAPTNATEVVRARVDRVTEAAVLGGVLEAYRWCLRYNETAPAARPDGRLMA